MKYNVFIDKKKIINLVTEYLLLLYFFKILNNQGYLLDKWKFNNISALYSLCPLDYNFTADVGQFHIV